MNLEEKFYKIQEAISITGLKENVLYDICKDSQHRGLSYKNANGDWVIHSTVLNGLNAILVGNKEESIVFKN